MKALFRLIILLITPFVTYSQEVTISENHEYGLYSKKAGNMQVTVQRADLYDSIRDRNIPIIMNHPKVSGDSIEKQKLVIISHGYGYNTGKSYLGYSFIADYLSSKGYFVVSIQHELPNDDTLAIDGPNLKELRMPNWERGVKNIDYVIKSLSQEYDYIDTVGIILIGHSNGGDMSALYATEKPQNVSKLITLDNRRMPLPKVNQPKILSIRSNDQQPDPGVLPTAEEQLTYGIEIAPLKNTIHNDMCNSANTEQKAEMLYIIGEFMKK